MEFKEKIKKLRQQVNLTQEQLAHVAGVTDTCYQAYEYGIREPKARTAIRIAKALGTTVENLWDSNSTK